MSSPVLAPGWRRRSAALVVSDHRGTNCGARALVDEDQPASKAVARVGIAEQRLGYPQSHPADLVKGELLGVLMPVQGVDVELVVQIAHDRLDRPGCVLDDQAAAGSQ